MKKVGIKNNIFCLAFLLAMNVTQAADLAVTSTPSAIPWKQIGAKAGADYKSHGLAVTPTESGARLRCVFQRLEGEASAEGLWLTSTVTNTVSDRFRVTAMEVGRKTANATFNSQDPTSGIRLAGAGEVSVSGQTVRFRCPGLTEEYSISMDGLRQDFIVEQSPLGPPDGQLVVKLAVSGAQAEPTAEGARLVLQNSGLKIAYSRLRVTDATGKELLARIEVCSNFFGETSLFSPPALEVRLLVVVNDTDALYPVRIDPTFSDANWSALGSGVNTVVAALAVSGSTLYVGGDFTKAGGSAANYIAQWDGNSWSALGSGMNDAVTVLTVSGSTLYAGGDFTTAGTNKSAYVAMANLAGTPVPLAIITTNAAFGFSNGMFGFDVSGPTGSNVIIQASTNLRTWIPLQTNLLGSGLLYFSDSQSPRQAPAFLSRRIALNPNSRALRARWAFFG